MIIFSFQFSDMLHGLFNQLKESCSDFDSSVKLEIKKEPTMDQYTPTSTLTDRYPSPPCSFTTSSYPAAAEQPYPASTVAYPTSHESTYVSSSPYPSIHDTKGYPVSALLATSQYTSTSLSTTSNFVSSTRCSMSPTNISMPADTTTLHTSPGQEGDKTLSPTG